MADTGSSSGENQRVEAAVLSTTAGDGQRPKVITVNVDYSSDMWMVVQYEDETGETYQGILLKTTQTNNPSALAKYGLAAGILPGEGSESSRKGTEQETMNTLCHDGPQQLLLMNGASAPSPAGSVLDPHKLSSVALRRMTSNGTGKMEADVVVANTKPALGIRRLENRSVRLRPTTSQRNTVLCAKCQEQCVYAPPARRVTHNGNVDRSRNGSVSTCASPIITDGIISTASCKRRSSEASEPRIFPTSSNNHSGAKKVKVRNGVSIAAAEAGNAMSAALPSASKISSSQENDPSKKLGRPSDNAASADAKNATPKVPKLKISFGNNEAKTTTIITLPQSYSDINSEADYVTTKADGNKQGSEAKNGCVVATGGGETGGGCFDDREGALLPGGHRVGDVVWAKMKSSPYWPAKIFSANKQAACVTWCGSKQYGFVEFKAMEPFKETFHKRYNSKRVNNSYQKAVAEAIIKNSGGDGDSVGSDSFYYQRLVSALCWKYLTGAKATQARARPSRKNNHPSKTRTSSGHSKAGKRRSTSADGLDAESVTSASSMSSPHSLSIDWQPRVSIGVSDRTAAESRRLLIQTAEMTERSLHAGFGNQPLSDAPRGVDQGDQVMPMSPLPVEKSEDDEEDDDEFKPLQIDEAACLDDDEEELAQCDASTLSLGSDGAASISPAGNGTYRLIPTASSEKLERQRANAEEMNGVIAQGARARVGEAKDDFESALTELQEMNEMCSSTSVLAQC